MKIGTPAQLGFDDARLARIAPWMDSYVTQRKFAGCSLLIARHGQEVFHHATGLRDLASGAPFSRDTVARIYSMTKPVTTVALMMLVEKGLFHLDTPVSEFIPAFAKCRALVPGASKISQTEPCAVPTLHQLLTHTSGLSYDFNPGLLGEEMLAKNIEFRPNFGPLQGLVDTLATLPLAFQPGSRWEYSVGIDVIGRVIEVVSGKSLSEYFRAEILQPLGMTETGFSVPKGTEHRFAALYTPQGDGPIQLTAAPKTGETLHLVEPPEGSAYLAADTFAGGGGLVSTLDDYMRFAEMIRLGGALDGTRLLAPGTVDFMRRNHLPGDIASMGPSSFSEQPMTGMGFGLGGSVVLDPARTRVPASVGDFSWGGLASTFFWVDRLRDLSVVLFTQLMPSSSYPARAQLKALVHGAITE